MPVLRISELFASLQGEGVSMGVPATFLRLGDCNLNCRYCDTRYSWDWQHYVRKAELLEEDLLVTASRVRALVPRRLVITGGEPLLQQPALQKLVEELGEFAVEVETNGTIDPCAALRSRVCQWNVSPKLSNSGIPEPHRLYLDALLALRGTQCAWLKFVVVDVKDLNEIDRLVATTNWPAERVILMPEATSLAQLADRSPSVAEAALQHGYRFSTRLQLLLWGNERRR
jgi:organic radical activating enzyme